MTSAPSGIDPASPSLQALLACTDTATASAVAAPYVTAAAAAGTKLAGAVTGTAAGTALDAGMSGSTSTTPGKAAAIGGALRPLLPGAGCGVGTSVAGKADLA